MRSALTESWTSCCVLCPCPLPAVPVVALRTDTRLLPDGKRNSTTITHLLMGLTCCGYGVRSDRGLPDSIGRGSWFWEHTDEAIKEWGPTHRFRASIRPTSSVHVLLCATGIFVQGGSVAWLAVHPPHETAAWHRWDCVAVVGRPGIGKPTRCQHAWGDSVAAVPSCRSSVLIEPQLRSECSGCIVRTVALQPRRLRAGSGG